MAVSLHSPYSVSRKKLKLKLGLYFRIQSCLSFQSMQLVASTFMAVLDYSDVIYMNVLLRSLSLLDHCALRLITDFKSPPHRSCLLV